MLLGFNILFLVHLAPFNRGALLQDQAPFDLAVLLFIPSAKVPVADQTINDYRSPRSASGVPWLFQECLNTHMRIDWMVNNSLFFFSSFLLFFFSSFLLFSFSPPRCSSMLLPWGWRNHISTRSRLVTFLLFFYNPSESFEKRLCQDFSWFFPLLM